MTKRADARCPCCGARIEYFPDQDGACDYRCTQCTWHQHVPGDDEAAEARSHDGMSVPVNPQMLSALKVDLKLLKQQAVILRKVVDKNPLTDNERSCLESLWKLVHTMIDGIQSQAALDSRKRVGFREKS